MDLLEVRPIPLEWEAAVMTPVGEHDDRPWGSYDVLLDGDTHKVKTITVLPGKRLSYQRHSRREEHWVIVTGTGSVTLDGTDHAISAGDVVNVDKRIAHRIANTGDTNLTFIEVQLGDYFGEDDIERLEDDFGRADG